MVADTVASDRVVHHVESPLLIAGVVIEIGPRWRRGVRGVLVEVNFGEADWQVDELGREPRHTQQKPEQQLPDVLQGVHEIGRRILDTLQQFLPLRGMFLRWGGQCILWPSFRFHETRLNGRGEVG